MGSSIKIKYRDGGVYIQAIRNRKLAVKKLFSLDAKYWNDGMVKTSHPNASKLNRLISKKTMEANARIIDLEDGGEDFSVKDILTPPETKKEATITVCGAIMQKAMELKNDLKSFRKLKNVADHFEGFGDMPIDQFGFAQMKAFEQYLNDQPRINSLETSARYLKDLKRCLRVQKYHDQKVLDYRLTFGSKPRPKLTMEEIEKIAAFDNPRYNLARDVFLACFYSWGSRISSVLTWEPRHIRDGRLIFLEYKGKKKTKSVKLNPQLQAIFDRYRGQSAFYLLPVLSRAPLPDNHSKLDKFDYDKHIENHTSPINRDLKVIAGSCGITKNVSTHVARHSFAYLSLKTGMNKMYIQKMLGHTTFQMTEDYLKSLSIDDELDNAADMIY